MSTPATSPKASPSAAAPPRTIGQRATRQRAAVAGVLQDVDDFRSAQALHEMLKARGENVGLATVYRSLQAMVDIGEIDVLVSADGESLYRRCGQSTGHHHHLVCRDCGLTVEVEGPAVERWTHAVATAHGFTDVSHTLDIFGLCERCSSTARPKRS